MLCYHSFLKQRSWLPDFDFAPWETCGNVWRDFCLSWRVDEGRATAIQWVEARDAANCPAVHRTVPTAKEYLFQSVSSSELEKPVLRHDVVSFETLLCRFECLLFCRGPTREST